MKKLGILLIVFLLTIIFNACPPLEEDYMGNIYYGDVSVVTLEDPSLKDPSMTDSENLGLDVYKWFKILDKIAKDRRYVSLDLSKGTFVTGNTNGGLVQVTVDDGSDGSKTYLAFDPFPASSSGKNYIVSITLPTVAKMIRQAKNDEALDDNIVKDYKKFSAFKSFTNLRSVKADEVTLIGNLAFADCTALTEVIFPKVGHAVTDDELKGSTPLWKNNSRDIGKYAFLGCTGLKEVKFNSVAVIGAYAFKDCTSLSRLNFPEVWRIEENAFEGCKSLVNVFFEKVSKIGEKAFKDCTSLKKAEFNVKPDRFPSGPPPLSVSPCVYDSVIFYPSVFTGCKSLGVLNIRRAWNVYFSDDVFAKTGSAIEIYLYDEPSGGSCVGHPQNAKFLGNGTSAVTLKKIIFYVPLDGVKVWGSTVPDSIFNYTNATYAPGVDVSIFKRTL